jgi:hypothetical protein
MLIEQSRVVGGTLAKEMHRTIKCHYTALLANVKEKHQQEAARTPNWS